MLSSLETTAPSSLVRSSVRRSVTCAIVFGNTRAATGWPPGVIDIDGMAAWVPQAGTGRERQE